jgi:hypothetical protein
MKTLRIIKVMIKLLEDSIGRLLQTLLITTWRIVRWSSVPMITVVQWQNIREKAKRHHIKPLHRWPDRIPAENISRQLFLCRFCANSLKFIGHQHY